jgi:hypothetical protein
MKMFAFTLSILACSSAAPAAPRFAPHQLGYFIGHWRVVAVEPTSGDELSVCYAVQPLVGQSWFAGVGKSEKPGVDARDVWGQDPLSGEVFRTVFDSSGTYALVKSPGWSGEKLVLEGDARSKGGTIRVRESIRREGPDNFTAVWDAWRDGKWQTYSIETAVRTPAGECRQSPEVNR